jgi:excisionase family DNA binding protein
MSEPSSSPLFVRLPSTAAERLDRAAFALGASKKDVVTALLQRHVDPDTPGGLDSLRRVVVEAGEPELVVGRHAFRPAEQPEVLDAAQLAELLQVVEADVVALAEAGDLPARRIGDEWRFSRAAVLEWLGSA